jgi:pyrophosphatase PpaX
LKSKDLKLGIYTGKARRSFEISCNHLDMGRFFDFSITGDDVEKPKPDPEGLVKALSIMNLCNHEVLYVGDSDADIEAGFRAGIKTIGVTWFTNGDAKFITSPSHIISDINEFVKCIENE